MSLTSADRKRVFVSLRAGKGKGKPLLRVDLIDDGELNELPAGSYASLKVEDIRCMPSPTEYLKKSTAAGSSSTDPEARMNSGSYEIF
jgi:hypothetical protein